MSNWKPTIKRLLGYSYPYRVALTSGVLMLWLAAVAEVTATTFISYFIDHIRPDKNMQFRLGLTLALTFLGLHGLSATLRYLQSLLFYRTSLQVVQQLRTELMATALRQPLSVLDTQPVGKLISRVTNDTEVIKDLYFTVIATILRSMALISTILVTMFLLDWRLACLSLVLFPVVLMVMVLYQQYSTPIVRRLRAYLAEINDCFNEVINGMSVIQQFRQQQRFGAKLKQTSSAHFQTRMATRRLEGYLLRPLVNLLFALVLCGMLLIFGFSPRGTIGMGVLYAFITYLGRLNEPMIELTSQQTIIQQAVVAGERMFELMDSPIQAYGNDDRSIVSGSIELRDLTFAYHEGAPAVLRQISLSLPPTSFMALVGHTGSGKSTLASLIMGYYPVKSGQLLLDGRSIETLTHRVLRNSVAMVQQDPVIMADSVFANVTLGREISERQVWEALEQVKLAALVRAMPYGIWTELGEQGNRLSVGQKQLLALARVLVFTPRILLLDEATAHIDSETEQAIQSVLQMVRKQTTLIVIAHRLSTIVDADQIVVLHGGEVVEHGSHDALLQAHGRYYQMYRLQQTGKSLAGAM